MPRQLRHHVPGGWYHLTARGIGRRAIFEADRDREHFLELLGGMVGRYGVVLHAYVLIENHYHLLVESPEGNVSRAMQWLNTSYGVWFNLRHGRSGALFQSRFKSIPVDICCREALRTYAERNRRACRNEGQGGFVRLCRNWERFGKGP